MNYPVVAQTSLSEDAQFLYARRAQPNTSAFQLDRDWLDPQAHRMSKYGLDPARLLDPHYEPSEALLAAVGELVEAGYAQAHGPMYEMTRVDPEIYTVAVGQGFWDVHVSRVSRPGRAGAEGELIAVLTGSELVTGDYSGPSELQVNVRAPVARDEEHDPAFAARISVQLPTAPQIVGPRLTFWGVANEANLYPLGTDPTLLDARTHQPMPDRVWCDRHQCADSPHPVAPYQPPRVELSRALLCIEARPSHGA
ncbi:hypothetical protein LG293_16040 (plasmid) [Citricoccus nitrophenolicus]